MRSSPCSSRATLRSRARASIERRPDGNIAIRQSGPGLIPLQFLAWRQTAWNILSMAARPNSSDDARSHADSRPRCVLLLRLAATIRRFRKGGALVNERPSMRFIVERLRQGLPVRQRCMGDAKRRPGRVFQPQPVVCLDQRALLSTFAASPQHAAPSSAPPWTEVQNVSFPTVNGQSELLDVYTPDTPAPAGGYPVMVTIHGGIAQVGQGGVRPAVCQRVLAPDGYLVVAQLRAGRTRKPTWPVNFEDVQAAVPGCGAMPARWA